MKVSVRWLRELAELPADDAEIARRLTAAGIEVEGEAKIGAGVSGVIVAEVRASRRHPQADKLTLVDVWDGREVTQVVCGAPNVPAPGGRVAWARPGATLPGGVTLQAKEVRGILSPGMLCAEDELGLSEAHAGIVILDEDAEAGGDAAEWLGLPDTILELNVTPNRPDCLGHLGVARELTALLPGARLKPFAVDVAESDEAVGALASVRLDDAEGCPRYSARVLTGVRVGQSPLRARLRLQALGIRAINDVVDATNLGLLETGHPLHAFDLDKLAGHAIVVRRAREGEPIVTLDGQTRALTAEDVAICDAERPVAVAGVMGGRDSEVGEGTTRLLLESAHFQAARVRRTARRLALHSEAAQRFERGTDPNDGVVLSSLRCARRIAAWTGAKVARGVLDAYPKPIERATVALRPARAEHLLGVAIPVEEQVRILGALGLAAAREGDRVVCRVPTYRPDLTREVDLIEEVARVHGYDKVPAVVPRPTVPARDAEPLAAVAEAARDALAALGLDETISFAFVAPERLAAFGFRGWQAEPLTLRNPLREESSLLRTSLLPGLLGALGRNQARGVSDVRLFEIGNLFRKSGEPLPEEIPAVAGVLAGRRGGWLKPGDEVDFFDLKGAVEGLCARLGARASFRAVTDGEAPWLHPGVAAAVAVAGADAGTVGELHPAVADRLGLAGRAFVFELRLAAFARPETARFVEPPRFPGSSRDLSFFVDAAVPAAAIEAAVAGASPLVESVRVREDYREPGRVPPGKKGMLWTFLYRARDRTLTDDEVNRDHARVADVLRSRFQIEQR